jgi:hypothetical protein
MAEYQRLYQSGQFYEGAGRAMGIAGLAIATAPFAQPVFAGSFGLIGTLGGPPIVQFAGAAAITGASEKLLFDSGLYLSGLDEQAFARYYTNPGWTATEYGLTIGTAGLYNASAGLRSMRPLLMNAPRGSAVHRLYRATYLLEDASLGRYITTVRNRGGIPEYWLRGSDVVDEAGRKIPGQWLSTKDWVASKANNILKYWKLRGVGTGARSGQHGVPYNRAAQQLRELAKDQNLLDDVREELIRKAKQFEQRAREINHPMR